MIKGQMFHTHRPDKKTHEMGVCSWSRTYEANRECTFCCWFQMNPTTNQPQVDSSLVLKAVSSNIIYLGYRSALSRLGALPERHQNLCTRRRLFNRENSLGTGQVYMYILVLQRKLNKLRKANVNREPSLFS